MVPKLVEILGTKYVIDNYVNVLERVLEENDSLDIADARFTPKCAEKIMRAKITLVDSLNPRRDYVLSYNKSIHELENVTTSEIEWCSLKDMERSLSELNSETLYTLSVRTPIQLIVALQLARPEIQIDCGGRVREVFQYVNKKLDYALEDLIDMYDDFMFLSMSTIVPSTVTTKNLKEPFEVYPIFTSTWEEVLSNTHFLPAAFGKEKLAKIKPWDELFHTALKEVSQLDKVQFYTLKDFIQSIGGLEDE